MYAILDIETTGGQYNEEGITEIAIYQFDGQQVTDQFISLVNPEIPIQPFVVKLTGINNEMLRLAPKFFEVAKRIIEITQNCILVAHNATFDHRILKTEFNRLGYDFDIKTLCTVELAKILIPDQPSYSLGKLVQALGIPMADRHRANGDAMATVKLFKMLLDKDTNKTIVSNQIKTEIAKKEKAAIAPKLLEILQKMPTKTGVYYMYNQDGEIIYIGKSNNIKKRINQHFSGIDNKSKKIQKTVFDITTEETGTELIALLKESDAIKTHKPILNRAQRKSIFNFALYATHDQNGYLNLKLQKIDTKQTEITVFESITEGRDALFRISAQYALCQKLNGIYETQTACFQYKIKECNGACIQAEIPEIYNKRVQEFIDKNSFENKNFVLYDKGRTYDERSAVWIENGIYRGFAYFNLNFQIQNSNILKNILIPMTNNRDTRNIIQNHLKRNQKTIKIKYL